MPKTPRQRALCIDCGQRQQSLNKQGVNGPIWRLRCQPCNAVKWPVTLTPEQRKNRLEAKKKWSLKNQYPWRLHKGDKCERCGFVPEDTCQLDVDHIDGDRTNNQPSNYQTLCANCHRLKTKLSREGMYHWHSLASRRGFATPPSGK